MAWCSIPRADPTCEERDLLESPSLRRVVHRDDLMYDRCALVTDAIARVLDGAKATIIAPTESAASSLFETALDLLPHTLHTMERTIEIDTGMLYVVAQDEFLSGVYLENEYLYVTDADLQSEFVADELEKIDDETPLTISCLELPSFVDDSWEVLGPYDKAGDLVA